MEKESSKHTIHVPKKDKSKGMRNTNTKIHKCHLDWGQSSVPPSRSDARHCEELHPHCQYQAGAFTITIALHYIVFKSSLSLNDLCLCLETNKPVPSQLLNSMSYSKLNVFHWHVTDSQVINTDTGKKGERGPYGSCQIGPRTFDTIEPTIKHLCKFTLSVTDSQVNTDTARKNLYNLYVTTWMITRQGKCV